MGIENILQFLLHFKFVLKKKIEETGVTLVITIHSWSHLLWKSVMVLLYFFFAFSFPVKSKSLIYILWPSFLNGPGDFCSLRTRSYRAPNNLI